METRPQGQVKEEQVGKQNYNKKDYNNFQAEDEDSLFHDEAVDSNKSDDEVFDSMEISESEDQVHVDMVNLVKNSLKHLF